MLIKRWQDKWRIILLFFAPAVFLWLTALVLPFFYGIWISFLKWDGIGDNSTFIGFANYAKVLTIGKFWTSLERTAIYTLGTVVLSNLVGMLLGLLLTSALPARNAFRTGIFVPNVVGGVAMGYIWKYLFNLGLTNIGTSLGISWLSTSMLSDPGKAMIALIIVSSWQLSSYLMIIYVAGFTNVPHELVEAARVDGASSLSVLTNVRLPMIRSSFTICLFLSIVRSFMVFEVNMSLTSGGPFGSTELIAYRIYNTAFVSLKFGNAQAQAVILFIVVAAISVLQAYLTHRREIQL